jgi:DNA-binding GntR family transcriptional regulator
MAINSAMVIQTENLREKAYRIIKQLIITCAFDPGSILNERELVESIGVSRTPIREALNRLEKENLVTIIPQRGAFVSAITVKVINDIYQLREIIEPCVTAMVTPVFPAEGLEKYRQAFEELGPEDYDRLAKLDNELHCLLIDLAGNDFLNQVMANMYAQNERIRFRSNRLPQRVQESVDEHLTIIEAILARDPLAAQEAMRVHLAKSRQAAFKI